MEPASKNACATYKRRPLATSEIVNTWYATSTIDDIISNSAHAY